MDVAFNKQQLLLMIAKYFDVIAESDSDLQHDQSDILQNQNGRRELASTVCSSNTVRNNTRFS